MTADQPHRRRPKSAVFVLSAGALAGVLIWSKLRLATDIPRSAYAEPEERQIDAPGGPVVVPPWSSDHAQGSQPTHGETDAEMDPAPGSEAGDSPDQVDESAAIDSPESGD